MADESKRFPMLDGPSIDWITAKKIYEMYSCLYGYGQTLERIAERGGFGWSEVTHLQIQYKRFKRGQ